VLARFRLDGRAAIVAGGTGGIGSGIAHALAAAGARVAVVGRDEARMRAAVDAIQLDDRVLGLAGDMTRAEDADRVVAQALDAFGRLDVLVNAVGGGAGKALYAAEQYPADAWDWIMELNLTSVLLPSQAAARAMIAAGRGGRILNLGSVRGQLGIRAGYSAYVAAKGAVNALTRQHAVEWAPHGITVNAVSPTFVETEQTASLLADETFRQGIVARIPLDRIGQVDDLLGAALFFCSDASSFVTGQVLTVDGGLTATQ
jgi:gluconate 5-dehydrogenase